MNGKRLARVARLASGEAHAHKYPVECACGAKLGGGAMVAVARGRVVACPQCDDRLGRSAPPSFVEVEA